MKKLPFFVLIFLMGCSEMVDVRVSEPNSITDMIEKVETSYYKGASKNELVPIYKEETEMAPSELIERSRAIDDAISKSIAKLKTRYSASINLFSGYDVGVVPTDGVCPAFIPTETVWFFMDCQDGSPSITGWDTAYPLYRPTGWQVDQNKNVKLTFCRVDGRLFRTTGSTYANFAVLRLGANVPASGPGFTVSTIQRDFDNEDNNNTNNRGGDIAPNGSNSNTSLLFYRFQGTTGGFPNLGFSYGVLGGGEIPQPAYTGRLTTDDEDRRNANRLLLNGASVSSVPGIIGGGSNTSLWVMRAQ